MENGGSGAQAKREAQRIADEMQDRLEGMRVYAQDAGARIGEFAREKPLAAIALAAGLGFILGRLLSRS